MASKSDVLVNRALIMATLSGVLMRYSALSAAVVGILSVVVFVVSFFIGNGEQ